MSEDKKVLTLMVEQFQQKHGRLPERIVVAPVALNALGLKRSIAPIWEGVQPESRIEVECRLFNEDEVASKHERAKVRSLGIFVKENRGRWRLVACDLK